MNQSQEGNGETILVVEDENAIRKLVCSMLLQGGYTVCEAADGQQALELMQGRPKPVDLVLTDMIMPQMTGTELAQRLAETYPALPVLFMSGYCDDPAVQHIERVGARFLAKPFSSKALLEKVRVVLEPHRSRTQTNSPA